MTRTGNELVDRAIGEVAADVRAIQRTPMARGELALARLQISASAALKVGQCVVWYVGPGGHTLRLPPASGYQGLAQLIVVVNAGADTLTVAPVGNDTIDGESTLDVEAGEQKLLVSDGASAWRAVGGGGAGAHAVNHQNGGEDEIDVTGLSGLLADPQTPLDHAADHEDGGDDEINVEGLSGLLADPQEPLDHDHDDFGASGTSHASGFVPDPGATRGGTRSLAEDGTWKDPRDRFMVGQTEKVLFVQSFDFDRFISPTIIATITGRASRTVAGTTATFYLRIGGTDDETSLDGDARASFTQNGALALTTNSGAAFAKPSGKKVVKITAKGDHDDCVARLQYPSVQFEEV